MLAPLTCVTYNICSLGQGNTGTRKRCDIRNFLKKADPQPEVILLQETHLGIRDCISSTSQLHFKGGRQFWNEAKYSASTGKHTGGTGILVSKRLVPFIEQHGVIVSSRVQYITFKFSAIVTIGIVNVYGYNQLGARTHMWHTLALHDLPPTDKWLWGGDWNVVELQADRSSTFTGTAMTRSERGAWSSFLMRQGLTDVYSSNDFSNATDKHFTWQGKRGNMPIFSRIDRFYVT